MQLLMLSPSAGTLSGRPSPARLEQGEQIVAGSLNIRTEEGVGGGGAARRFKLSSSVFVCTV